ncbi:unnamed protein product, partial [Polarella glacialis]
LTAFGLAVRYQQFACVQAFLDDIGPPPRLMRPSTAEAMRRTSNKAPLTIPALKGSLGGGSDDESPGLESPFSLVSPKSERGGDKDRSKRKIVQEGKVTRGADPFGLVLTATDRRTALLAEQEKGVESVAKVVLLQLDSYQRSPLLLAVRAKNSVIAMALLEARADPEAPDVNGDSVLHVAIATGQREIVETLMELRVNVDKVNKDGKTPLDLCQDVLLKNMLDRQKVASILKKSGTSDVASSNGGKAAGKPVKPKHRIRLEGLPREMTEDMLYEQLRLLIKRTGAPKPVHVSVALDPITSRRKGYAYADFMDGAAAELASVKGDGQKIGERKVRVFLEIFVSDEPPPPEEPED